MSKPDNPPAFPYSIHMKGGDKLSFSGMTLRDYFAAKALPWCLEEFGGNPDDVTQYAAAAYQIADAMLREREREPK